MSNPNTKALSLASKKSLGSNMRVAYIEKDSQLVNLAVTSSVNSYSWRKSASYESFKRNVYSLATARTVVDLISMVSNVLPQDTGATFQEAQSAAKMVMDNVILVSNLEPLVFLTLVGKVANIKDIIDLKSRSEDISFLRFNCVVNGAAIDSRVITVNLLSFQFSLKLPQYIYDITAYTATPVVKVCITPVPNNDAKSLTNLFQSVSTPPSLPDKNKNTPLKSAPLSSTTGVFSSPAMKLFFASASTSKTDKRVTMGV